SGPEFSPDGKKLAYRAQKRAGFEADRWDLMVVDVDEGGAFKGKPKGILGKHDLSVNDFAWHDAERFLITADSQGAVEIFALRTDGEPERGTVTLAVGGQCTALSVSRDGSAFAFAHAALDHPNEVMVGTKVQPRTPLVNVSRANDKLLAELEMPRP